MRWCSIVASATGLLVAGLCSLSVSPASAQTVELERSAVAACLTLTPGEAEGPQYPFDAYKSGQPGQVVVDLLFTTPDRRPAVEVVSSSGDGEFIDAVRQHVRHLRVPCLPSGQTARLRQEYVFKADGRPVYWGEATDTEDPARKAMLACLKHTSGERAPRYPSEALRRGLQGRVLVLMRFTNDDQAPQVQVLSRPGAQVLADEVTAWVRGYRLPCHSGQPIQSSAVFLFKLEGNSYGFKALTLQDFAGVVKHLKTEGLQMDTRNMGCPFDVKLNYRQPVQPNQVGVLGAPDIRRQPLVDWLRRAELEVPARSADSVFADTADIHVPCANFAIAPSAVK